MAFEIGDGINAIFGAGIGTAQGKRLSADFRPGDAALSIGRDAPAANDSIGRVMVGERIFLAHEHHHAAAFTRPEAGGLRIKNAHLIAGKSAEAGEAGKLEGIEAEITAAGNGNVHVTTGERSEEHTSELQSHSF